MLIQRLLRPVKWKKLDYIRLEDILDMSANMHRWMENTVILVELGL